MRPVPARLLICLSLFLLGCSKTSSVPKNDLGKMNLKGKVKSIQERSYGSTPDGTIVLPTPGDNAEQTLDMDISFDQNGNKIKEVDYIGNEIFSTRTFEYDSKGHLTKEEYVTTDLKFHTINQYTYDDMGRQLEEKRIWENHYDSIPQKFNSKVTNTKFDQKGNPLEQKNEVDGKLKTIKTIVYNNQGKPVEEIVTLDGKPASTTKMTYDKQGNLLKSSVFDENNQEVFVSTYTYDKNGNQTSSEDNFLQTSQIVKGTEYTYDKNNYIITAKGRLDDEPWTYSYTFDAQGNWIEQKQANSMGTLYVIKRTIEYW